MENTLPEGLASTVVSDFPNDNTYTCTIVRLQDQIWQPALCHPQSRLVGTKGLGLCAHHPATKMTDEGLRITGGGRVTRGLHGA